MKRLEIITSKRDALQLCDCYCSSDYLRHNFLMKATNQLVSKDAFDKDSPDGHQGLLRMEMQASAILEKWRRFQDLPRFSHVDSDKGT